MAFLTRIPTPLSNFDDPSRIREDLRLAPRYFPVVGGFIGTVTFGVVLAADLCWPLPVAVLIGLACEALLTGAFHEDAVADFFDAFGGGWNREDILRILKDSRIGSFGLVGLGLAMALRAGGMMSLSETLLGPVMIASSTLGRWNILVVMMCVAPVAERDSISRDVGQRMGFVDLIWGTVLSVPGSLWVVLLTPVRLFLFVIVCGIFGLTFSGYLRRRLGGVTGDCLGCVCYLTQVLVLLLGSAHIEGVVSASCRLSKISPGEIRSAKAIPAISFDSSNS